MKTHTTAALLLLLALPAGSFAATEPHIDQYVRLTPENSAIGNFPARKAAILTVKSGAVVKIDTGGGAGWRNSKQDPNAWLKENGVPTTMDNPALQETQLVLEKTPRDAGIENGHLLVGPIAIEGAMPGDSLEVRIISVVPRIPYGTTGRTPGGGLRQLGGDRPPSKVTILDLKRNVGVFEPGVEVPLGPFMGVMGVMPAASQGPNRRSGPPGAFAGNLDCKELVTGTTLYLPVFQKGGLFFTGDAHAAQGDGEISGTAIETANTATFQFILHKGKTLLSPRAETPTHYITFGLDPDLDNAMQMAVDDMVDLMQELKGWDMFRTIPLASMGVDFRVTQIVDGTKGIHAMIPKKLFVNDKTDYWYKP
ncbi:MAG: acetamidase/formamidase family protein [Gammaproteobacteria bacterium]